MLEKRLIAVAPQSFTSNGTSDGIITVADASLFKVKQEVILSANTLPNLDQIEVKRVLNATQLAVGPKGSNIDSRSNISTYTTALSATIFANEQKRPSIPFEESTRAVYEEEPTVALRTLAVDKLGNPYTTDNPFPVDATVSVVVPPIDVSINAYDTPADNVLIVGSEDGTRTGTKQAFVNNVRLQILATHNRDQQLTYADFGTKDERITVIDYTSPTFPGVTARKTISYTLVGNKYRRDSIVWSIV